MFKKALIVMLIAEAASFLVFGHADLNLLLLISIFVATLIITWRQPYAGFLILLGELFVGSRGHLFNYNIGSVSVSLRLVVFMAVFLASAGYLFRNRLFERSRRDLMNVPMFVLLLAAVLYGIVWGVVDHNGAANVFNDANGYLYLLILPLVWIFLRNQKKEVYELLQAAVVAIAIKTILVFLWFLYGWPQVAEIYQWIVFGGSGEITGTVGAASRIFLQSQFYSLVGLLIATAVILVKKAAGPREWLVLALGLLTVFMSLSRSFWLGLASGGLFLFFIALLRLRVAWKKLFRVGVMIVIIAGLEAGALFLLTTLGKGKISDTVASRTGNPIQEAAGGARLLLLPELIRDIANRPLAGMGFGEQVTYSSYLPDRVTKDNPEGKITSFAFEWGYLDIWLKIGLIGLLIYLLFIAGVFRTGWQKLKGADPFLIAGFLSGLVALLTLNLTTPYLNHPLGIGYLILCFLFFREATSYNIEESAKK